MHDSNPTFSKKLIRSPILKAVFAFLIIDLLLFQSGIYGKVLSPNSIAGMAYYFAKYEKKRKHSNTQDILVTGDSKISEGFSASLASELSKDSNFKFIQGGIPGATLRSWYFILRTIDPARSRYKAVVITLPSYRKIPYDEISPNSRTLDSDILAPILGWTALFDLGLSFPTWNDRIKTWMLAPLRIQTFRSDFQDLLFNPATRWKSVVWRKGEGENHLNSYKGHDESMTGLVVNNDGVVTSFPHRLNESEKNTVRQRYTGIPKTESSSYEDYSIEWLSKIAQLYYNSNTKIIFLRCPTSPIPNQNHYSLSRLSHFLNDPSTSPNILVIPEDHFGALEAPNYFFDTLHLNALGRLEFTKLLAEWIQKRLELK